MQFYSRSGAVRGAIRRAALAGLFASALLAVDNASAQVADLAIFSSTGVNVGQGATVTGGVIASNSHLVLGPHSTVTGLQAGGNLTSTSTEALITSDGPWIVGGNIDLGSDVAVTGNVDAGGSITLTDRPNINGNLTANGSVSLRLSGSVTGTVRTNAGFSNGNFNVVTGNVFANGVATVNGTVNGNVTYGQALAIGTFGAVTGTRTQAPSQAAPAPYVPRSLPAAHAFTAGGANLTAGGSAASPLQPGSYGDVSLPLFADLYLAPGDYRFNSLTLTGSQKIHLVGLASSNNINVSVTGDVNVGTFVDFTVNGQTFANADKSLASRVLLETHGHYIENPLASNEIFGTIFAPNGAITLGQFDDLAGSLLASGPVAVGPGLEQTYVGHSTLVPEPGTLVMLPLLAALGVGRRTRSRAQ